MKFIYKMAILVLISIANISFAATIVTNTTSRCVGDQTTYTYDGDRFTVSYTYDNDGNIINTTVVTIPITWTVQGGKIFVGGTDRGSVYISNDGAEQSISVKWEYQGFNSVNVSNPTFPSQSYFFSHDVMEFNPTLLPVNPTIYNGDFVDISVIGGSNSGYSNFVWTCNNNPNCNFTGQGTDGIRTNPTSTSVYTVELEKAGCINKKTIRTTVNVKQVRNNIICCDQIVCDRVGSLGQKLNTEISGPPLNTLTYQWQSSTNNSTFTNVAGATNKAYVPPMPTVTTYYRRLVNNEVSENTVKIETLQLERWLDFPQPLTQNDRAQYINIYNGEIKSVNNNPIVLSASKSIKIVSDPNITFYVRIKPNIKLVIEPCKEIDTYRLEAEESISLDKHISNLSIYPNPSSGLVTFKLNGDETIKSISVLNVVGNEVYSNSTLSENLFETDLSNLVNGIYFVRVQNQDNTILSSKLTISK